MPIPARSIPTRMGAVSLSTGTSTEPDTHGREAALRAPTLIREDQTQRGKCSVSSSSIRSHSSQVRKGIGRNLCSIGLASKEGSHCPAPDAAVSDAGARALEKARRWAYEYGGVMCPRKQ